MNESKAKKRRYCSDRRALDAEATRARILDKAKRLLLLKGIDKVTIAEIAEEAGVAESTVYAAYRSKEGILRALMEQSMFGGQYQAAQALLAGIDDPVQLVARTARVARAIYESEQEDLGLLREMSGFSPLLRDVERQFEQMRHELQKDRIERLFSARQERRGLALDEARRIMWALTSRDLYRMMVVEGGWAPQRYEDWLAQTLVASLVDPAVVPVRGSASFP
jgi:AcrR family transcriptional regulator